MLAVVLRREAGGAVIAVEMLSPGDLLDASAELWFEALLRQGRFGVPLDAVPCRPEPIVRRAQEAAPGSSGVSDVSGTGASSGEDVVLGFSLTVEPGDLPAGALDEPVRCVFPRTFIEPVAARAARRLLDAGVLATGDTYTYELRAERPGDELGEAFGRRAPRAGGAALSVVPQARASAYRFDVVERPIGPLRERAEPAGGTVAAAHADDYPVFFTRDALARAEAVARKGAAANPSVETGGLLIGPLCSCPDTGELFAVVDDVLEATHSEATTYSLTYSGETWARIQAVMRAKQEHPATRGQRVLGQVHGHSFLPLEGAEPCAECATREICTRTTAFLSSDDLAWCRAVFRGEPWQLSQVFGLNARNEGVEAFFGQRGGLLVERGYSIVDGLEP